MRLNAAELRRRLAAPAPPLRLAAGALRPAAVLVGLEPERGVWLTRRTAALPHHAGQVSFPGGKIEMGDASPEAAALREAQEEIGLDPACVEILGRMDDLVTLTGFHIVPVLALLPPAPCFHPDSDEVAAVFCLPFATLLDPALPCRRRAMIRGREMTFNVWPHPDHVIWGATAEILRRLAGKLREAP